MVLSEYRTMKSIPVGLVYVLFLNADGSCARRRSWPVIGPVLNVILSVSLINFMRIAHTYEYFLTLQKVLAAIGCFVSPFQGSRYQSCWNHIVFMLFSLFFFIIFFIFVFVLFSVLKVSQACTAIHRKHLSETRQCYYKMICGLVLTSVTIKGNNLFPP